MTISTQNRTAGPFIGNGSTTVFPFSFKVFADKDMLVVRTEAATSIASKLGLTADYTVTLNANQNANPGGSVTLATPLAAGYVLVLTSELEYLQPLDLTNQGGFYPAVITAAFDRVTILLQQLFTIASRSLRFPVSDTGTNTELPQRSQRANNLLGFDANGNPVAIVPSAQSAAALQGLLSATGGAGLVGYGTRTVFDKLGDMACVRDAPYSVKGDGSDETVAINAALAGAQYLYFVPGATYVAKILNITRPGQIIHLNGALLKFEQINVAADNVSIYLDGGEMRGPLHVGKLAAQAAVGQKQLVFEDASQFKVGDIIWCSYGDNNVNWPLANPTAITAIAGNTVTLATNLAGTVPIPVGTYIGTFSWGTLVGINASKNLRFYNGKISNAPGYFMYSWRWNQADFATNIPNVECYGIDFDGAGLDSFLFVKTRIKMMDCTIGKTYDVAKTGFAYGDDVDIELVRCRMFRGNMDSDFTPIADASRSTFFQGTKGRIKAVDCYFDGKNNNPAATYFSANCFHPITINSGGAAHDGVAGRPAAVKFGIFEFDGCTFNNYSRSAFSTTVVADAYPFDIDSVIFRNCKIGTQAFQLKSTGAIAIRNFVFDTCQLVSDGPFSFTQSQSPAFVAKFNHCALKLTGTAPELTDSEFNHSTFYDCTTLQAGNTARFDHATLRNSTIRTSAIFGYAQFTGTFLIDNPAFAANGSSANLSDMGIMYLQDGQGSGIRVKSVNGTHWYDVAGFGGKAYILPELSTVWFGGAFGSLNGDDWILGIAQNIRQGFGGQFKATYSLPTTLGAAAGANANTLTVTGVSYSGNRPLPGDKVFVQLANGTVNVGTVAAGYADGSLSVPLTAGIPAAASNGAGVWFMRAVAL